MHLHAIGGARDARLLEARRRVALLARATADGGQLASEALEARLARELLDRDRELALPVGMLVDGAGQVRLRRHAEHVLHLHQHDRGGCLREEGVHRAGEVAVERASPVHAGALHQPLARERRDQRRARFAARGLLRRELGLAQEPERVARLEVLFLPPTGEGGQVVRRPGDQRAPRVARRRPEAGGVALEEEEAIREHFRLVKAPPQALGDGAQVLADHHAVVALAFEGDDAEHLLDRVADVRAVGGLHPVGHPVEAREPHHMVDAQRARARHVGAQRGDEGRIGAFAQAVGRKRRQPPILPQRVELVGRRAHAHAERVGPLVGPCFRAVGADRDGEVGVEAHRHAELAAQRLGLAQLQVRLPLEVLVQADARAVVGGEALCRFAGRVPVLRGPVAPRRAVEFLQRLVHGMVAQGLTAHFAELRERARAARARGEVARAEMRVDPLEHRGLAGGDRRIVHVLGFAQTPGLAAPARRERGIGGAELVEILHRVDGEVERIQE